MERKLGYYWINDGDGGYSIAEYVGDNQWVFAGCSSKFETDPEWIIGNRIKPNAT
jgi:hypothetical protein